MAAIACPLCGEHESHFVRTVANRDPIAEAVFPTVSLSVCRKCGLIHQNPRISRKKMVELYATLEDKAGGGVTQMESESRLTSLQKLKLPPAKILEVGCSDGTFLGLAAKHGYEVAGIDPSRINLQKARLVHRNIPFHLGFLEEFKTKERFDVICHFYVLEYSFNPRRFLASARRLLKPDGIMLIEVPDAEAFPKLPFANSLFSHQDIAIFTRATLESLLKTSGFSPLSRRLGRASKMYGLRAAATPGPVASHGPSQYKPGRSALQHYFKRRDAMIKRVERRVESFHPAIAKNVGPVVVFGAGENGRIVTSTSLARNGREIIFCDNNPELIGHKVDGHIVVAPGKVPRLRPALVIAASIDYQDDMVQQMRSLGIAADRIVKLYEGY